MRSFTISFFFVLSLVVVNASANTAQPGIFRAGGTTQFMLLYPGDSIGFRKVQMVDEKIAVQLYRGFAVVKGTYKMYNPTDVLLTLKVGYPVNSQVRGLGRGSTATEIFFDQLYALKSYSNGKENMLIKAPIDSLQPMDDNNWYVWVDTFKPKDTTTISVYFIVNTNNAEIIQGYRNSQSNAFIYLLETGATWKQPILSGEVKIELMDELTIKDIKGLTPTSLFNVDAGRNILVYKFTNLSPTFDDNVALVYTPNMDHFDFAYISQKRNPLFASVDSFSLRSTSELTLAPHTFKNPYDVEKTNWGSLAFLGIFAGGSILGLILLVWLIKVVIRYIRNKRPQRGTEM